MCFFTLNEAYFEETLFLYTDYIYRVSSFHPNVPGSAKSSWISTRSGPGGMISHFISPSLPFPYLPSFLFLPFWHFPFFSALVYFMFPLNFVFFLFFLSLYFLLFPSLSYPSHVSFHEFPFYLYCQLSKPTNSIIYYICLFAHYSFICWFIHLCICWFWSYQVYIFVFKNISYHSKKKFISSCHCVISSLFVCLLIYFLNLFDDQLVNFIFIHFYSRSHSFLITC